MIDATHDPADVPSAGAAATGTPACASPLATPAPKAIPKGPPPP